MQLTFEIELNPDAELLFGSVDTTRVTTDRFLSMGTKNST